VRLERGLTRLIQPAPELTVELDPHGAPARITGGPLRGAVLPLSRWVVDQDWWETPIKREYWKVMVGERLLAEIYQDQLENRWYLERLYD
jgi:hypothetical protein